ncbi:MAG: 50S ribosomal protein L11 [Methanobacteriota archaeon]
MAQKIEALVDGGKASAGPPLGPALGPMGVNVMEVIKLINEKTKSFAGMRVPVKVVIDEKTKKFDVEVGTPPTSALLLKEIGVEKGSGDMRNTKIGNITLDQLVRVSKMKEADLLGKTVKARVKEVSGTCVSMGITCEGKDPREFQKLLDQGKYDAKLK